MRIERCSLEAGKMRRNNHAKTAAQTMCLFKNMVEFVYWRLVAGQLTAPHWQPCWWPGHTALTVARNIKHAKVSCNSLAKHSDLAPSRLGGIFVWSKPHQLGPTACKLIRSDQRSLGSSGCRMVEVSHRENPFSGTSFRRHQRRP